MARLYNKTEELQGYPPDDEKVLTETTAYRHAGWDGDATVWRLEAQLKSEALQTLNATRPQDLPSKLDGIWQYLFVGGGSQGAWLRLVDPATATRRERCGVDERWRIFADVHFSSVASGPAQRVMGRRRGLSVPEVTGSLLSHLGSAGLLQLPRSGTPMQQLEQDVAAFVQQAGATVVAKDYPQRRAAIAAKFTGLPVVPRRHDDGAASQAASIVAPPTAEERTTLTFLEWVRSQEANLFLDAPEFQRLPTFEQRPEFVARARYYERRLRAYSQAWEDAVTSCKLPDPQLRLDSIERRRAGLAGGQR
ncbi:MAG: hypothetical protein ABI895_05910 [Deltaproteobacteria bacterium]